MELQPSEPPGNAKRKLRVYVSEIARLRAAGYTIKAIHQALEDVGVHVAWATVQRESARLGQAQPPAKAKRASALALQNRASTEAQPGDTTRNKKLAAAKEIDAHFASHNSNPLFKKKVVRS
jgi:DNA-binding transcriptional MerR regulator